MLFEASMFLKVTVVLPVLAVVLATNVISITSLSELTNEPLVVNIFPFPALNVGESQPFNDFIL